MTLTTWRDLTIHDSWRTFKRLILKLDAGTPLEGERLQNKRVYLCTNEYWES